MPISTLDYPTLAGGPLATEHLAQARSHSYALLGRLFLEGVTETLWPYVQRVPDLAAAYPQPFSADDAAAAHYHLFAFHLFPYESFFRTETGLSGGPVAAQVAQVYQQAGFDAAADAPDHIGQELTFLAYLTEAEANAWESQQPALAQQWRQVQHNFLSQHLLAWLIPFVIALPPHTPFYGHLGRLTLELVADHEADLTLSALVAPPLPVFLDPPDLSDNPRPWEFVRFWVTPAHSGLFLSRDDISRVAHLAGVVHGFGKRDEMLKNALDAAATADSLPLLFQALSQFSHHWQTAYTQLATDFPHLSGFIAPWQKQAQRAEKVVKEQLAAASNQ